MLQSFCQVSHDLETAKSPHSHAAIALCRTGDAYQDWAGPSSVWLPCTQQASRLQSLSLALGSIEALALPMLMASQWTQAGAGALLL